MNKICQPNLGKCSICGRRQGCRKIKEVSPEFIEKWGIEHLLISGMVVSNGEPVDGKEVFFWTQQACEVCKDLIDYLKF